MKATYQDISLFNRVAQMWLEVNPADTKFRYALTRMLNSRNGRISKLLESYNNELEDINVSHAAVFSEGDKKSVFIREANGNYSFTKEGSKEWNRLARELWHKEVEVEPYLVAPKDTPKLKEMVLREGQRNPVTGVLEEQRLSADAQRTAFEGFVIPFAVEPSEPLALVPNPNEA